MAMANFNLSFEVDKKTVQDFESRCEVAIRNVLRGTKKATEVAAREILEASLEEVPSVTATLASSGFYEVSRRTDTSASYYVYEAVIGYGGNGDPINPNTGQPASYYMMAVHEDLTAIHPNGKAKFLEDPVREYATKKFNRTVFKYAQESLAGMSG